MKGKRLLIIAFLLCVALSAFAVLPPQQANLPLPGDPNVLSGKLANGLTYYIVANDNPHNIAEMRLFVNVGSVNEDEDQRGLAHFTEHMAFNGTKSFAKNEVVEYLSSIGMGYMNGLNGMTSYDFTVYTFKLPTDNEEQLRKGTLILSEMASSVAFAPEEIERERGVILEEYRLGQGAQQRISDAQNAVRFAGSRYAERSPIGTKEVLENFTPDTIRRFYRDWYHPGNQSVVVVGDFDPQAMLALITEYFGAIPAVPNPRPVEIFPLPVYTAPRAVVSKDKEYPYSTLMLNWHMPTQQFQTYAHLYESTKQRLFSSMLNARLSEVSRRPNAPFAYGYNFSGAITRTLQASILLAIMGPNQSSEALAGLLTEAERVQRYGFGAAEFDRAKAQITRELEQAVAQKSTKDSDAIAWEFMDTLTRGDVKLGEQDALALIPMMMDQIALEEVNAFAGSMIQDQNMFISLAGPDLPNITYPTVEELFAVSGSVSASQIEPWQDLTVDKPLMTVVPAGGSIVKELNYRRNGYKKWTLSNGIVVYAKKTDFKQDEVMLSATSPGGYSQLDQDYIPAAQQLGMYLSESGFGDFDAVSLEKALIGKVAYASLDIGLNTENLNAGCSPQDMETMFQMLYQYATNARFNEDSRASFLEKVRLDYENKNLDPMQSFFETHQNETYNNHPYSNAMRADQIDTITLDKLEYVYRDRYADLSDFTYFIVGNFDEARLKEMVSTYLATLPKVRRKDVYVDRGIRPVIGEKDVIIHKGSDPRSFYVMSTHSPAPLDYQSLVEYQVLDYIMNEKLRENIREARSGVYVIQSWASPARYPSPNLSIGAFMACSPDRVYELNEAIIATIDSVKAGAYDDHYLNDAKTTLLKMHQENIRTNSHWVNKMINSVRLGRPVDAFVNTPRYLDMIDKAAVSEATSKYLDFDTHKLTIIMLPEEME